MGRAFWNPKGPLKLQPFLTPPVFKYLPCVTYCARCGDKLVSKNFLVGKQIHKLLEYRAKVTLAQVSPRCSAK